MIERTPQSALETIRVALPNGWTLCRDLSGGWAWVYLAPPKPQALGSSNVLPLRQPTTHV